MSPAHKSDAQLALAWSRPGRAAAHLVGDIGEAERRLACGGGDEVAQRGEVREEPRLVARAELRREALERGAEPAHQPSNWSV